MLLTICLTIVLEANYAHLLTITCYIIPTYSYKCIVFFFLHGIILSRIFGVISFDERGFMSARRTPSEPLRINMPFEKIVIDNWISLLISPCYSTENLLVFERNSY